MNQQQRKYALERIESIYKSKIALVRKEYTKPSKSIDGKERLRLIKNGKVKIKKGITRIESYSDVVKVFDFSKYSYPETLDEKKYKKAVSEIKEKKQKVIDELMLGDNEKALEMIKEFEKQMEKSNG